MYMNAVACPTLRQYMSKEGGGGRREQKGGRRTLEPPRLHTYRTTLQRPRRAVRRRAHTATGIHPLHAIWKGVVRDEVVASPARVGDDCVCVRY